MLDVVAVVDLTHPKACVLSPSRALRGEHRSRGIQVLALRPRRVNTDFFDGLGTDDTMIGQRVPVEHR